MTRNLIYGAWLAAAVVIFLLGITLGDRNAASEAEAYTAPGLEPMTLADARDNFYRLAPALLGTIYQAFALTQEDEIYDTLASVTDGDALEYLYLERASALAQGGLQEGDQTIHEIEMVRAKTQVDGPGLAIDAVWQVIGTVGHAEHMHVRGNTYSADLQVMPVEGAWRVTGFVLREVNRDTAGETFLAPEENE
ncbi:MAG: hypothetical protein AAF748_13100 [Pseudomonadota bacterium]